MNLASQPVVKPPKPVNYDIIWGSICALQKFVVKITSLFHG